MLRVTGYLLEGRHSASLILGDVFVFLAAGGSLGHRVTNMSQVTTMDGGNRKEKIALASRKLESNWGIKIISHLEKEIRI